MNEGQTVLVERLKEASLDTRRFLKILPNKHPEHKVGWQKNPYTPEELEAEGCERWGVIGMLGLVGIDTDTEEMTNIVRNIMPPTFESISPRRKLPHFLFAVTDENMPNKDLFLDSKDGKKRAGEIRSQGKYLVAPGSEIEYEDLETGERKIGRYKILHNRPIANVSYADFMKAFSPYFGGGSKEQITGKQMREGVARGNRHPQGIKYATFLIRTIKLDEATALYEMKRWNELCKPPLDVPDLKRMIDKALVYVKKDNFEIHRKREPNLRWCVVHG